MKSDNRAFVELSWDDQSADAIVTVFHEEEGHHVGIYCKPITFDVVEPDEDKMACVKELLIQIVESL